MTHYRFPFRRVEWTYVAPALLCNAAFIVGTLPVLLCWKSALLLPLSLTIFGISLALHGFILYRWKRYKDASPFAYAIVQPTLHLIVLVYALAVGSITLCAPARTSVDESALGEREFFSAMPGIAQTIAGDRVIAPPVPIVPVQDPKIPPVEEP